ncbi:hypothetical protein D9615_006289 [Tricholomella constricta]|uniref:G-alpha-domain-containing protein n=1 Tax=Tricholomella constricta TaxID=117010 RepID=A0A8H5HBG2_9AGAR|nr:hypothetical protein D9615_006289 [Tricholomella constricta]
MGRAGHGKFQQITLMIGDGGLDTTFGLGWKGTYTSGRGPIIPSSKTKPPLIPAEANPNPTQTVTACGLESESSSHLSSSPVHPPFTRSSNSNSSSAPSSRTRMSTASAGLSRRRAAQQPSADDPDGPSPSPSSSTHNSNSNSNSNSNGGGTTQHAGSAFAGGSRIAYDPRDMDMDAGEEARIGGKPPRLTIMEEVLLLGIKDKQGYLSFWNDNISYALRGCILIELALRRRIALVKDPHRRRLPLADRLVEVVDDRQTGETILDEALRMMKSQEHDRMGVNSWIDLLSGETWNVMKIGFQLKQVRERLAKGLVDKGVLRTEKRNFLLFDMATHPVADVRTKESVILRAVSLLTATTASVPPGALDTPGTQCRVLRAVCLVCAAYTASVLDNAFGRLGYEAREAAFGRCDEILGEFSVWPFGSGEGGHAFGFGAGSGEAGAGAAAAVKRRQASRIGMGSGGEVGGREAVLGLVQEVKKEALGGEEDLGFELVAGVLEAPALVFFACSFHFFVFLSYLPAPFLPPFCVFTIYTYTRPDPSSTDSFSIPMSQPPNKNILIIEADATVRSEAIMYFALLLRRPWGVRSTARARLAMPRGSDHRPVKLVCDMRRWSCHLTPALGDGRSVQMGRGGNGGARVVDLLLTYIQKVLACPRSPSHTAALHDVFNSLRMGGMENDPFAMFTAPPPDETPAEKSVRERREAEQKRVSDRIDEQIKADKAALKKQKSVVKVLLLGQSESDFRMKYARAAWKAERLSWRAVIQLNLIRSILTVLDALQAESLNAPTTPLPLPLPLPHHHHHHYHHHPRESVDSELYPDDEPGRSSSESAPIPLTDTHHLLKLRLGPLRRVEADLKRRLGAGTEEVVGGGGGVLGEGSGSGAGAGREFGVRGWKHVLEGPLAALNGNSGASGSGIGSVAVGAGATKVHVQALDEATEVIAGCAEDMKALWADGAVQAVLRRRNMRLEDSAGLIATREYEPSDDDIVRARLRTLGIQEHKIQFEQTQGFLGNVGLSGDFGLEWMLYDVGGSRTARNAWLPYFEAVNAIIFQPNRLSHSAISCFDERLLEDPSVNRLEDSLLLWRAVCRSPLLAKSTLILFLNKCDLLKRKLRAGAQVRKFLPSYGDRPNDAVAVVKYLREKFKDILRQHSPEPRVSYFYATSVTDTRATSTTLKTVRDSILREHLKNADFV